MRVVIAPDKFKGSLSAPEVIHHLQVGLRAAAQETGLPLAVVGVPVADGGEGTLDAAIAAGFDRRTATVTGPAGTPVTAAFAVRDDEAIIEMAAASGLQLVPEAARDPLGATSQGTGELISAALATGCRRIILAIGGSASTDGGADLLRGLGARLLDRDGADIEQGGGSLLELDCIDLSDLDPRLTHARIVLASDVDNPLLGSRGAAAVFGPQKGASPSDIASLEHALQRYVDRLAVAIGPRAVRAAHQPGAGAAGGVGYSALAVLHASREPGFDIVAQFTGLRALLDDAGLVITGEGSLDEQSLAGKTPIGVARIATTAGVPVIAVCGRTTLDQQALRDHGIYEVHTLINLAPTPAESIRRAPKLLEQIGQTIGRRHFAARTDAVTPDR